MKVVVIGAGPAGLYFGILARKAIPDCEVTIFEKNAPDVTWGWGVVFSDETLENFEEADFESHRQITEAFTRWDDIDIHFKGRIIRSGGHSFYGIRRTRLLQILQKPLSRTRCSSAVSSGSRTGPFKGLYKRYSSRIYDTGTNHLK